jgi:hypothetical protein
MASRHVSIAVLGRLGKAATATPSALVLDAQDVVLWILAQRTLPEVISAW